MLHKGIIPGDSTLDVAHFADEYSVGRSKTTRRGNDWVFARQWYSTLVDLLTAEKKSTSWNDPATRGNESSLFLWQNRRAELGIMPIPISLSHFLEFGDAAKHISCWGDWHLIMTKGSENTELGIDLVNSLMASQKICERAFQCAGVPTVEEFYTLYGDSRCLNLPERRYETPRMLPDITFSDLRKTFFANAFSRSQIFDYQHCMLELHSLVRFVRTLARCKDLDWSQPREGGDKPRVRDLKKEIHEALNRIKKLRTRGMLTV